MHLPTVFQFSVFGNIFKVSRIPNFFQKEKILAFQSELLVGSSKISSVTYNDLNS
jgi:hypothetical protein